MQFHHRPLADRSVARRFRSKFVFSVDSLFHARVSHHLDRGTFPPPATSNAAEGFPLKRGTAWRHRLSSPNGGSMVNLRAKCQRRS